MHRLAPSHPALRHRGWCDRRDPSSTRLVWAGTGVSLRFRGRAVEADLSGRGMVEVLLDGQLAHLLGPALPGRFLIADQLPDGDHVVELRKRTEPVAGTAVFEGFLLSQEDASLPHAPPPPHLLFLGDSITCGYGNLAPDAEHGFEAETEDVFRSYAGIACGKLGLEFQASACSGKGLQRNFDRDGSPTIPQLWCLADPNDPNSLLVDLARPSLAVINLGSNDVFHDDPDWPSFVDAMVEFGSSVRDVFPALPLVLLDGPLLSDAKYLDFEGDPRPLLTRTRECLDLAVERLRDRGPVHRFSLEPSSPDEPHGADFHPSLERHRKGGDALAGFLRPLLASGTGSQPL